MNTSKNIHGVLVVASAWLAIFCLFGYRATFALLKGPMSADMGWSQAEVTLGYSFMMMFYAISAFFCGMILDRWGARPAYFLGALFGAAGFFVTSLAHGLYAYYASYGILAGVACGMLWVSSTVSIRKWYVGNDYAKMFGLAFMGAPLSQVVMAVFVKNALAGARGDAWRGAMQVLGILTLACLLLAALLARGIRKNTDWRLLARSRDRPAQLPAGRPGAPRKPFRFIRSGAPFLCFSPACWPNSLYGPRS